MATPTARGARVHHYREPLSVEQFDLRSPGAGETRVDLTYAGVNPFDGYNARGQVARLTGSEAPLPRVVGGEASGWCDGVPVVVSGSGLGLVRDGTWASAVVVPHEAVTPLAASMPLREASAVASAGLTAFNAVEIAQVTAEDHVLVLGATGGVGSMIVSLARAAGAEVSALTGSPTKASSFEEIGADHWLVGGPEAIAGTVPTVVFDALAGEFTGAAVEALSTGGRLVVFGVSSSAQSTIDMRTLYRKRLNIYGYVGLPESNEDRAESLRAALQALADGSLRIRVHAELPLADANEALDRLRRRDVIGKLVLNLDS